MLMKYWNLKLKIEKPSPKSARVFLSVERGIFDGYVTEVLEFEAEN